MADREPLVLELDSETMWTLADDRKTLSLNITIPVVGGLTEPLTLNIDFDPVSVELMIERLAGLYAQMDLSRRPPG